MDLYIDKNNKCHLPDCNLINKDKCKLLTGVDIDKNNFNDSCYCMYKYNFIKEIEEGCRKYDFDYEFKFGSYFIKSKISRWKFDIPTQVNGKITLYHKNLYHCKNPKIDYHKQFTKAITAEKLMLYMYNHDLFKYSTFHKI